MVIADRGDAGAAALVALISYRRRCAARLVDQADVACAVVRHIPASGPMPGATPPTWPTLLRDSVALRGGEVIGTETECVLCRAGTLTPQVFADVEDQEYAAAEMHALGLSWLWGLGRAVVNRPSLGGLGGCAPDIVTLARLAADVGLRTPPWRIVVNRAVNGADGRWVAHAWDGRQLPAGFDGLAGGDGPPLALPAVFSVPLGPARTTVLVCGGQVVGAPEPLRAQLVELCREAGTEVCELTLAGDGSELLLALNPVPALRAAPHLLMLAQYLEQRAVLRREGAGA